MVAPAELALAIQQAANARGVRTVRADSSGTTSAHHACGYALSGDRTRLYLTCPHCDDHRVDQDENATLNLLELTSGPIS